MITNIWLMIIDNEYMMIINNEFIFCFDKDYDDNIDDVWVQYINKYNQINYHNITIPIVLISKINYSYLFILFYYLIIYYL